MGEKSDSSFFLANIQDRGVPSLGTQSLGTLSGVSLPFAALPLKGAQVVNA